MTRRALLHGAATLGGAALLGASRTAFGADSAALRGGEILPDPDFGQLREANPYVIGVRPHRHGGVRVEVDAQSLAGTTKPKVLLHNYGHGGAGITLSWGCASVVVDLVERALATMPDAARARARVAVLGTGVAGLTVATEVHQKWPRMQMAIYAKSAEVQSTTSFIAGGQFEPSGIFHEYEAEGRKGILADYLRRARDRIVGLQASAQRTAFGVAERKDYTLDHENRALDAFTPPDVIAAYRRGRLPFERLRVVGREYQTWLMNPMILLPKLAADLARDQVPTHARTFASLQEVASLEEEIVINCTGLGAKSLFADAAVVPQRGHLVILRKTDPKQLYFFSGGCANPAIAYVFCRQDDIVVGGSVITGNDSLVHAPEDEATFQRIVANGRELFAGRPSTCKA
jgi:D-amino-acid oxidase